MSQRRIRLWAFTLNNPTDADLAVLNSDGFRLQCQYYVYGREIGELNGTPHLQGFMYFFNAKTKSSVKKILTDRFHIEQCHGTASQNISYCTKDGDYVEYGERPKQGERKDIENVKKMVLEHKPINEIVFSATSYQSARHAELLMKYQPAPPPQKRIIKWYWGSTGTGKTRTAVEESNGDYYITMKNLRWWDGYYGQGTIIVDDFRADFCTFHELLRLTDCNVYRVETKGSSIYLQPSTHTMIFTSPYHPRDVYNTREDIDQFIRRIDEIRQFFPDDKI